MIVPSVGRFSSTITPQTSIEDTAPNIASYRMDVRLDPAAKTVTGTEQITYTNPSQDTLSELWMRLYLRAFRSKDTIWMRESGGGSRGYTFDAASLGDITVETLELADGTDLLATSTLTDTLLRVPLPHPLGPGATLNLNATWTSKLPRAFARTGYGGRDDTFFMVGQWYPKMAVYDRGRWDTEPWHANSEFFNDFGKYDVTISVPKDYVVAGAGIPAGEQVDGATKTLRYTATGVTDFAFAASPDFLTRTGKAGTTDVVVYYLPEHAASADEYMDSASGSLQAYSSWYGPYPHPRLTVVDVPDDAGGAGGMEYPTLVTGGSLGAPAESGFIPVVVTHEVAHQWWPMQTATNEGKEPWLDEGLTEYSGLRYMEESGRRLGNRSLSVDASTLDLFQYAMAPNEPATLPAWKYSDTAYGGAVYGKTALGLWTLENVVGTDRLRHAMATYLAAYRFKHPTSADFRSSMEESLGDLDWFFKDFLDGSGEIDYRIGAITPTEVTIVREGSVPAPVDIETTYRSGRREIRHWDGRTPNVQYTTGADDPFTRVVADPQRCLVAELDVRDNGRTVTPQIGPAVTLSGRLSFWQQCIAMWLGLFG